MANKQNASVEETAAMDAAPVAAPDARDDKRTADFLNEFASTPKQTEEMREMIERRAPVEEWAEKFLKGRDPVGTYARYFKSRVEKVIG